MGAPTAEHETRVDELRTLASLSGFTVDMQLPWRLRPDVVRLCPVNLALFVGDAKHTENHNRPETRRRLRWYFTALAGLPDPAFPVTVALAVPAGQESEAWGRLLVTAAAGRMACDPPRSTVIGRTIIVAMLATQARGDRWRPYSDRTWLAEINSVLCVPSISSAAPADSPRASDRRATRSRTRSTRTRIRSRPTGQPPGGKRGVRVHHGPHPRADCGARRGRS